MEELVGGRERLVEEEEDVGRASYWLDYRGDAKNGEFPFSERMDRGSTCSFRKTEAYFGNGILGLKALVDRDTMKEILVEEREKIDLLRRAGKDSDVFKRSERFFFGGKGTKGALRENIRQARIVNRLESGHERDDDDDGILKLLSDDEEMEAAEANMLLIQEKQKVINQKLDADPHDVDAWMQLVDIQIRGSAGEYRLSYSMKERILDILEKAIILNPDSYVLISMYVCISKDMISEKQQTLMWSRIICNHMDPLSSRLWKDYLLFQRSHAYSFTVSKCRIAHLEILKAFKDKIQEITQNLLKAQTTIEVINFENSLKALDDSILFFIRTICSFEAQSGFRERSAGIQLALLDFNLVPKRNKQSDSSEPIEKLFEKYWKVYQSGFHKGFNFLNFIKHDLEDSSLNAESFILNSNHLIEVKESISEWIALEVQKDFTYFKPASMEDIAFAPDVLDYDAVVVFEDIQPYLIHFSDSLSRKKLAFDTLISLGYPSFYVEHISSISEYSINIENQLLLEDYENIRGLSGISSLDSLRSLCGAHASNRDPDRRIDEKSATIYKILTLLSSKDNDNCYRFAFILWESYLNPQASLKSIRKILKKERTNWAMWVLLARICSASGAREEACRIFDSALTVLQSYPSSSMPYEYSWICLEYVQLLLTEDLNSSKVVFPLLCCLNLELKLQDIDLTQADRTFAENRPFIFNPLANRAWNRISSSECFDLDGFMLDALSPAICGILCFAIFEYRLSFLSESSSRAIEVFLDTILTFFEDKYDQLDGGQCGKFSRWIHCFMVEFTWRHYEKEKSVASRHFRNLIHRSLELFPSDVFFLSYYSEFLVKRSSSTLYSDFLGRLVESSPLMKANGVLICLFASVTELRFSRDPEINIRRARRILEKFLVLSNDYQPILSSCRQSIALWRFYIRMEAEAENLEFAKKVFYRAIHACPWSKKLFLDGMSILRNVISPSEFLELLSSMTDKELRLSTEFCSSNK